MRVSCSTNMARKLSAIAVACAALLLPLSAAAVTNISFSENFSSLPWVPGTTVISPEAPIRTSYGDWTSTAATIGSASITTGSRGAMLRVDKTAGPGGGALAIARLNSTASSGSLKLDFNSSSPSAYIYLANSSGVNQITIAVSASNNILLIAPGGLQQTISFADASYTRGLWATFSINFDREARTASFLMGDSTTPLLSLSGIAIDEISQIKLGAGTGSTAGTAFFTNLDFTGTSAIPEPATWASVAGVLAVALVFLKRRSRR